MCIRSLRPVEGSQWINNLKFEFDFDFFLEYHQDLWAISANVNNYIELLATHYFTKFNFVSVK